MTALRNYAAKQRAEEIAAAGLLFEAVKRYAFYLRNESGEAVAPEVDMACEDALSIAEAIHLDPVGATEFARKAGVIL